MKLLRCIAFLLSASLAISPAYAILTSNSQGKSSLPDEIETAISVNSSIAIEAVAVAVRIIEESGEISQETLPTAAESLDSIINYLSEYLPNAGTDPLSLEEVTMPEGVDPEVVEESGANPTAALDFLKRNIEPWPPTEQQVLKFLLSETIKARASVQMMIIGAEQGSLDVLRVGFLTFDRYIYSAAAYSLLWDLA